MRNNLLHFLLALCLFSYSPTYAQEEVQSNNDITKEDKAFVDGVAEKIDALASSIAYIFEKGNIESDAEATEAGLLVNRNYQDLKEYVRGNVHEKFGDFKDTVKSVMDSDENMSELKKSFDKLIGGADKSSGRIASRENYSAQILSCYSNVNNKNIQLVLKIMTKNGYRLVRSIDGQLPFLIKTDFSLSKNIEQLNLYDGTANPMNIDGNEALAYGNPFYFPVYVSVNDINKPLELIMDVSFFGCKIDDGSCKEFKDRVGIVLYPDDNKIESPYCQNIRNHYGMINDEKLSPIKFVDTFYAVNNGMLSLIVEAEFPTKQHDAFLVIENNYGLNFETSEIEKESNKSKFIAVAKGLNEDLIKNPITIYVGDSTFSLVKEIVPRFDEEYQYDIGDDSVSFLSLLVFIIFGLLGVVIYAKVQKLPFYNKRLLLTIGGFAMAIVVLYISALVALSYFSKDNYINNPEEIEKALDSGKNVYINSTSSLCIDCLVNDFLFNYTIYAKSLIAQGKLITFKADVDNEEQNKILKKYGIKDAPGGIFITRELSYGIILPKKLSLDDVTEILNRYFKQDN